MLFIGGIVLIVYTFESWYTAIPAILLLLYVTSYFQSCTVECYFDRTN